MTDEKLANLKRDLEAAQESLRTHDETYAYVFRENKNLARLITEIRANIRARSVSTLGFGKS